jgi:predicted transcriptional regulator
MARKKVNPRRSRQMDLAAFNLAAQIKLSYLRNMGDAFAVSKETGVPIDKVNKFIEILRDQESKDVSVLIANNLMQEMLFSRNSILLHKLETVRRLERHEISRTSWCCGHPVREVKAENGVVYSMCCKCLANATVKEEVNLPVMELKEKILQGILIINESLINMAKTLGYTTKDEAATNITQNKNYFVMFEQAKGITKEDRDLVKNVETLDPIEIEDVIKKLEMKSRNAAAIDVSGGQPQPKQ